jgi:Trk-type K+ transport system membrane component
LQIVTEKFLAANFALCIQEFAFKFLIISFGYLLHPKWPSTPKAVHINIIVTSKLCSFLKFIFRPVLLCKCVLKHRWRQREDSILSGRKGRAVTWHGNNKYRYGEQNISLVTRLSKLFPRLTSATVSHEWLSFHEIMLIIVSQIEFDPEMWINTLLLLFLGRQTLDMSFQPSYSIIT